MHAINPGCITDLERLAIEHGIEWQRLTMTGLEDDDLDEDAHEERHP
jgi:hypothetical protein